MRAAREPAWSPKSRDRVNPGELGPVTLIGAIATAALLNLRAPLLFHPAASRLALPASHVQLAAARSTEQALPPRWSAKPQKFQQVHHFRSGGLFNGFNSGSGIRRSEDSFRFRPRELLCGNMKLLTHNLLSSHVRGVGTRGFPLRLQATEVRINPVEFNPDFVARMIPKVEWAALVQAANTLNLTEVPKEPTEGYEQDETFLRKMHHVLLEVDVLEGTLQCPESGRLFPISRGIPNMLLNDEETET
ncbi:Multifunctional methyltransferase subunit TRM112-like protein [Microtus ochrogaster]|uniref:Multifunctional methyltransferase subunit TRM112-like protein n=2 Tax=Microtus ochrogaster TaxID=79684 RepID=A0A8J6GBF0_MICOH|nr:Multifunctional methyltransferase subunit TRM112-like protein [Microtus ochrogaster]